MSAPLVDLASWPANDTTGQWSAKIAQAWRDTVNGIFGVGDLLIAAKADPACRFDDLDLPFGRQTIHRLTTIAKDQRLRDVSRGTLLPPSWRTLYELTPKPTSRRPLAG